MMTEKQLLNTAINAALSAGEKIRHIYEAGKFETEYKAVNSPLTLADKTAHEIICRELSISSFPILSEEGNNHAFETRKHWKTFWLVDPLDGTKEFIKKNGEFTVNIALIQNEKPVLGVIYIPVTRELYFADKKGAYKSSFSTLCENIYKNAQKLPLPLHHSEYIAVTSGSHMNVETQKYIETLEKQNKTLKIINKGSSIKLCMLAEGSAHCYPRMGTTMEWDTAAGHAIARMAGKNVCEYPGGKELKYNKIDLHNPNFIVT